MCGRWSRGRDYGVFGEAELVLGIEEFVMVLNAELKFMKSMNRFWFVSFASESALNTF